MLPGRIRDRARGCASRAGAAGRSRGRSRPARDDHRQADDRARRRSARPPSAPASESRIGRSWSPTRPNSRALSRNVRISQTASPCRRVCTVVSSGRVPADVDADGDDGEHGRDAGGLRRQVGEVAREQRDRDLGRRVVDAAAHLAQHEADARAPMAMPPTTSSAEAPDRVPEREAAGRDRRDGERVGDERRRVVDQALALDQRHEPPRQAEPRADGRGRDGIGRRDDRADHEAHRPREAADRRVADRRDGEHGHEHEARRPAARSARAFVRRSRSEVKNAPE